MQTKLYRSRTNRVLGGVLGGIGEAYNVDATLLRLAGVVLALLTGIVPAVVIYLIAWAVIPEKVIVPGSTAM